MTYDDWLCSDPTDLDWHSCHKCGADVHESDWEPDHPYCDACTRADCEVCGCEVQIIDLVDGECSSCRVIADPVDAVGF